ncbi:MAG: outer membrane protein transport protein [Desulfuromonadaceae bacterium]|nr:outer membrane protein transport protein [Desulfuromonadaceae bacterium]MDD2855174.1 outer membrane protein transport protein [Desulfuromonadaceae bacterium]
MYGGNNDVWRGTAFAFQAEISSSLNPVGSGARATGMGGAFIAVADDATAASWNPAGLINLETPEVSAVFSYSSRGQSYNSTAYPELTGKTHSVDTSDLNYVSAAYPFQLLNRNMIVTLNYQRLYDMNKKISYANYNYGGLFTNGVYNYKQSGHLGTISPAIAIQVLPNLYVGATVNIWDNFAGTNSWTGHGSYSGTADLGGGVLIPQSRNWTQKFDFSAINYNFGLMYNVNKFTIGVVGKTPFEADVDLEETTSDINSVPQTVGPTKEKMKMGMPASYGVGISYRYSDSLTVAADLYHTQWSDFYITDTAGNEFNPLTTLPIVQGKPKDTTQVRVGGEYLFIGDKMTVPVRAGVFYDPEPGFTKVDSYYGFSLGSGVAYDKYAFDVSYQYRWGNGVSGDVPVDGVTADINQHTIMTSLIYHF